MFAIMWMDGSAPGERPIQAIGKKLFDSLSSGSGHFLTGERVAKAYNAKQVLLVKVSLPLTITVSQSPKKQMFFSIQNWTPLQWKYLKQ